MGSGPWQRKKSSRAPVLFSLVGKITSTWCSHTFLLVLAKNVRKCKKMISSVTPTLPSTIRFKCSHTAPLSEGDGRASNAALLKPAAAAAGLGILLRIVAL